MDPLTIGLITGGASLLGNVFSSNQSAKNLQSQQQWQEHMSGTAYQRATADMNAAGLNPAMMFSSGSAASTPQMPNVQPTNPMGNLGEVASKAVSSAIAAKTFDKLTEEIGNLQEQQARTAAETIRTKAETKLTTTKELTEQENAQLRGMINKLTALKEPGARREAEEEEAILRIPPWLRDTLVQTGYSGKKGSETIKPLLEGASTAVKVGTGLSKGAFGDRFRGYR